MHFPSSHVSPSVTVKPEPSADVMKAALLKIASIEDKMIGGEWEEIEEARQIAREALGLSDPLAV